MNFTTSVRKARRTIPGIVLAALFAAGVAAQDGKLYKWVDENGNVTYQDTPPPGSGGEVETIVDPSVNTEAGVEMPDVDVTFYAIEVCDACDLVRRLLQERGIPFQEKNAEGSQEVQTELREVAGALSVPVVQIGDQVLRGYNRDLLLNELEEAGFPSDAAPVPETETAAAGEGEEEGGENRGADEGAGSTTGEEDFAAGDEDIFDEDIFGEEEDDGGDDVTQWEEIPEDERIEVSQ